VVVTPSAITLAAATVRRPATVWPALPDFLISVLLWVVHGRGESTPGRAVWARRVPRCPRRQRFHRPTLSGGRPGRGGQANNGHPRIQMASSCKRLAQVAAIDCTKVVEVLRCG
jgi:hypothetical protein